MIPEYISRNTREKMLAFHLLHTVRAWKSDGRGSHASILSVRSSGNALQILASMATFSDPSPQATSASRSKPGSSDLVVSTHAMVKLRIVAKRTKGRREGRREVGMTTVSRCERGAKEVRGCNPRRCHATQTDTFEWVERFER